MRRIQWAHAVFLLGALSAATSLAGGLPSPKDYLGYVPGADSRLVGWSSVVEYFQKVDEGSARVVVKELGRTTENRPYLAAFVSNEATIARLEEHRNIQRKVADPRLASSGEEASATIRNAKPVVLITCSIHSDETASTFMAMELLHQLASSADPAVLEILENTILILVPSANPDGVDKVAAWYEKSKGHPWEGSGMPELYHAVAGHDTNRDWFMLNLQETRLLSRLLYHEWFPTITYDVHQMGSRGARMFVPPFFDPINPNLDPRLSQSILLIGAHMASDLASAGKRGVLTNAMYDNWWNGGNRTTPQRHNMVGVLTEAASVRMASPIFLEQSELRGITRGFTSHKAAVNFVDPWPGGWWRLRDVVDYELICARSVLTLAARYRVDFQRNYAAMARDAIAKGRTDPPYGWVVPGGQRDPASAVLMLRTLAATGIEMHPIEPGRKVDGQEFPAGSWLLPAAQPYRAHLKDMMERQVYPTRLGADGVAEAPYDVAGWTLPLQMGVRVVSVNRPLTDPLSAASVPERPVGRWAPLEGVDKGVVAATYDFNLHSADDYRFLNALHAARVEMLGVELQGRPNELDYSLIKIKASPKVKETISAALSNVSTVVHENALRDDRDLYRPVAARRIGLYHSWVPSMDEGWTRFVLEQFGFKAARLDNALIREGRLNERIDVLILPSIRSGILREGFAPEQTAPEFVGGLGPDCVKAIREFVRAGGTLVCLEDSCEFAIEELGLPVTDTIKGVNGSQFYCPGSILRAEPTTHWPRVKSGLGDEISVYFDRSRAFAVPPGGSPALSRLNYAPLNPLESGWLLGTEKVQGKSALVRVELGQGTVFLFAFPPQHRGQTHGTFSLLFDTIQFP